MKRIIRTLIWDIEECCGCPEMKENYCVIAENECPYEGLPEWCPLEDAPDIEAPCGEDKNCSSCPKHGKCEWVK